MYALIYVRYQHSYVLLFLCLYLLLHPAFVKFSSLVLARDDVVVACLRCFVGVGNVGEDVRARGDCSGRSGMNF